MANPRSPTTAHAVITAFAVPWTAFVAAFLYYVGLTLVAISVEQLPDVAMMVAYALPVLAYALALVARALQALAAMPVTIGNLVAPRLQ